MTATETKADLEQQAINVIRGLCMDGPQAANAGHPGTGMALAPLAHVLWTRIMKYDASAPDWHSHPASAPRDARPGRLDREPGIRSHGT